YADYEDMMLLTEDLLSEVAAGVCGATKLTYGGRALDLTPPWRRASLTELVAEHAGVEVDVNMPVDELRTIAKGLDVHVDDDWGPGKLVLEIYEKTTEGEGWGPAVVTDDTQEAAPLAGAHRTNPGYDARFEA